MPPLSSVAVLGEGHLLRIFCKPFTELKIQAITGVGRVCRDIVGICTLFWLEKVADDTECKTGPMNPCAGTGRLSSSRAWFGHCCQRFREVAGCRYSLRRAEEPQSRCWRAACLLTSGRVEATLGTPPDPTIQNQQWENWHRLQSIPAIGREAALQSQCPERMYAGAAADLLRNQVMLFWESCRGAGQKELLTRASSLR